MTGRMIRTVSVTVAAIVLNASGLAVTARAAAPELQKLGAPGARSGDSCDRCTDGDYLVDNGKLQVVIGGSHRRDESFYKFPTADALGSVVFLRASGTDTRGDIMLGTPYVRINNTTRHVVYDDVDLTRHGDAVFATASGRFAGERDAAVEFETRYEIVAGSDRIDVTLTATNVGPRAVGDFIFSVYFDPHQIYDFSPSDVAAHRDVEFRGYPRAMHLTGWVDRTPRVTDSDTNWGWDGGMILPDPVAVSLDPGEHATRRYTLVAAGDPRSTLHEVYREIGIASQPVSFEFASQSTDYFELVVRDARSTGIFYRAFLDQPAPVAIELPPGEYVAQANFFPGIVRCTLTVAPGAAGGCRLQDPPQGHATVRIVDSAGRDVPGKVSFHGIDGTLSPYFRPQNPAYDDGYWESARNSVFPVRMRKDVVLPVGTYRVSASRGPEYSIDEQVVRIASGDAKAVNFTIDRVLDRPDLVAMDPHLHTLESDGAVSIEEKIRALVAEGIDVAVATDHNFPVDYGPALRRLGLENDLVTIAGAEMTIPERLDYNTYPMVVKPAEHNHGAIDALSTDLAGRFAASRARDANVILQVNHPHTWQFDYFEWHELDPDSAAYACAGLDLSFDVLEVVNAAIYDEPNNRATRNDWFNLMRRGWFFPLVGSSDSHEIDQDEPGYSRTLVYRGETDGRPVEVGRLMERVRGGHSFASNGPLLDLTVDGKYRPGDTLTAADGKVAVAVDVWSAPWIEAAAVRLYVNGEPRPVAVRGLAEQTATHLRGEIELPLAHDVFVVAEVTGTKALSPVVQTRVAADGSETAVLPFALTNPVFVDVDGNGKFDPPLPHEIRLVPPQNDRPRACVPGEP